MIFPAAAPNDEQLSLNRTSILSIEGLPEMRLLFVFSSYPAETFAISEVEALRRHSVDVVPLSLRHGRRWLRGRHANRDRHHHRVVVLPFSALRTWLALFRFLVRKPLFVAREIGLVIRENICHPAHLVRSLYVCLKAPAVAELVRRGAFDAVHIFWGHYPALIIPFVKSGTPDVPVTAFLGAYSIVKRIPSGPRVLCEADALTTHFDGHVPTLRDGWLRRCRPVALIYRGVDLEPLKEIRPAASRKPRLVIVSRLAVNKTVEDGIRAFALIRRTHPESSLDVIGEGPCR
jgi:glycosyltransferase involved in cell wall biosynthesis